MEKRRSYLDVLSVLACFMVLWDHVDGMFHTYAAGKTWLLSVIIHVVVNPAVPLFVMISGANLLDYRKKYSTGVFFKKRAISVFIPFLFWSVFYVFFWWTQGKPLPGIKDAINGILYNNAFNGLFWFFYQLFGLYIAMPIFSAIEESNRRKVYLYCILGYMFAGGLIPVLLNLVGLTYNGGFKFEVVSRFLFYALFGYYIDHYDIRKWARTLIYIVGLASLIFNILYVMIASTQNGKVVGEYTYYTFILTAMAIFTLFRNISTTLSDKLAVLVKPLRDVTLGVFLVQRAILHFAGKLIDTRSVWYITLGIIPMFVICVVLCKMIKKCPGLRHII